MKKIAKKIVKLVPVLMLVMVFVFSSIYANNYIDVPTTGPSGTSSTEVKWAAGKVWATVINIVQILAVAAVVFAGIRYMVASADQKADIKRSLGTLAIGAILVFCASTVIKFIVNSSKQVIKTN